MRLVDADKVYPDCMTKDGTLAISQSQIANAPTVKSFTLEDIEGVRAETIKMMENRYARPQGEMLVEHCIEFNSNPSYCRNCHSKCTWFKCSKCSCAVEKEDRFCKHCGVELRGKEE